MTTPAVGVDISSYQPPVDDTYPHRWLCFRVADPAFASSSPDRNAAHNAAWCRAAKAAGKLDGWIAYLVYQPGLNAKNLAYLDGIGPLDHVMIDVESWGGLITGDHSTEINALAVACAARVGQDKTLGYANANDFATEWVTRLPWLRIVVASYGGSQPQHPNMFGWQYTNGQYVVQGLPSSSPPFGACDHNLYFPTLEDDLSAASDATIAEFQKRLAKIDLALFAILGDANNAGLRALIGSESATDQAVLANVQKLLNLVSAPATGAPIDETKLAADLAASLSATLPGTVTKALAAALTKGTS